MKKSISLLLVLVIVFVLFAGCTTKKDEAPDSTTEPESTSTSSEESSKTSDDEGAFKIKGDKLKVGYSFSRMNHPYRVAQYDQFLNAIKEGGYDWEIVFTDANNDANKQTSDIEDLIAQDCDIICMTPITNQAAVPACIKVRDAGIPLILIDRFIETDDYDYYIGADNVECGTIVAQKIAEAANGKDIGVLEYQITIGSTTAIDRDLGFMGELEKHDNITCLAVYDFESMRDKAMQISEDALVAYDDIFAIFSQNDEGALGILAAANGLGIPVGEDGLRIYGIEGQKETFDEIKAGNIMGTILFPTGTPECVELIGKIISGESSGINNEPVIIRPESIFIDKSNVDEYYDLGIGSAS